MKLKRAISFFITLVMIISISLPTTVKAEEKVTWTSEDFIYEEMSKMLYGCDYSREFTVKGQAIAGFSESGLEKLEETKELVLPSKDTEGNTLVGVAGSAFKGMGLTKVTFPKGMMVDYDDTLTHAVTKRGNFIIGEGAFSNNELTEVYLPEGVIAVLSSAFQNNNIKKVTFPHTIWWIETMSFSGNGMETVEFPETCDFSLEIHGMAFAKNNIKSVKLPDFVEVLYKEAFFWNPGMEPISEEAGQTEEMGIVYMYTDNPALFEKDRIHHIGKSAGTQFSWYQKLILGDGSGDDSGGGSGDDSGSNEPGGNEPGGNEPGGDEPGNEPDIIPEVEWKRSDFTYKGTKITGFSKAGLKKRVDGCNLSLPDKNTDGKYITEIASGSPGGYGLFATEDIQYSTLKLPSRVKKIGAYAFQNNGIKEIKEFPKTLKNIGDVAFQTNNLKEVVLPDNITVLGSGAFATNPLLEKIVISKGLTEISASAFGCSDKYHYMTNLTELEIPEGITKIGARAFAGNNIENIIIPSTVTEIGDYAFSTKNYLNEACTLSLPEGLTKIGSYAFRNKVLESVVIPTTVTGIKSNAFLKEYSTGEEAIVTTLYVEDYQLNDTENFETSDYHKYEIKPVEYEAYWKPQDFLYEGFTVLGWSERGNLKRLYKKDLVIPEKNPETGESITTIADGAFKIPDDEVEMGKAGINSPNGMVSVTIPETVTSIGDNAFMYNALTEVNLPKGLTFIGDTAFKGNKLTKVYLPDSVTTVETGAFATNDITEVHLSKSMTKIADGTFSMNIRMSEIKLHEGITEIGTTAFAGARFTSLKIPSTVEKIGRKAFHLHHLTELHVPGNVKEIGESAFEGTPKGITLKKLTLEEGIESIGSRAFAYGYLEEVNLPASVKSIASDVFVENAGINNDHIVRCYIKYSPESDQVIKEVTTIGSQIITIPVKPAAMSAALNGGHDDVIINWDKAEYATTYKVYYKRSTSKSWTSLGNTEDTYLIKDNLTDNVTYKFKVVPCNEDVYDSNEYNTVSITTLKNVKVPTSFKASLYGYDDVKLSWSKSSGASGYYLYYKKTADEDYEYLKRTTLRSCKIKNLEDGENYTFKIIPYYKKSGKYVKSYYSKEVSIYTLKKLSAPVITGTVPGIVMVEWENIEGESGYQISKSTSKSKTNIVSTYATTTEDSKEISAKKDKTYYYKVRAYKKVGSKKVYGPWSDVITYTNIQ